MAETDFLQLYKKDPVLNRNDTFNITTMLNDNWDKLDTVLFNMNKDKVDKITGKGLSTNDFTTTLKNKLDGIAENANNYKHPDNHSLDIITETATKKIMTDLERIEIAKVKDKVDKVAGKGLSKNDYTDLDKTEVAKIKDLATAHALALLEDEVRTHQADKANPHSVTKHNIGLGNVDTSAVRLGDQSVSFNDWSLAIGKNAKSTANAANAFGRDSTASGEMSLAIGIRATAINRQTGYLGKAPTSTNGTDKWIVPGSFTVEGSKNFEMPHPKPEKKSTHRIRHGVVESPTAGDTLYRFTVQSTEGDNVQYVDLPDYFIHLNKNVQIYVTGQGHFGNGYGELNIETEQLKIYCQFEGKYNVLVIGTRNDDHQSIQDWNIRGVEREVGESWTGETYAFEVDEIIEVEEIKEEEF